MTDTVERIYYPSIPMISDETREFSDPTEAVYVPSALCNVEGRIRGSLPQARWKQEPTDTSVISVDTSHSMYPPVLMYKPVQL